MGGLHAVSEADEVADPVEATIARPECCEIAVPQGRAQAIELIRYGPKYKVNPSPSRTLAVTIIMPLGVRGSTPGDWLQKRGHVHAIGSTAARPDLAKNRL